jgi:hypothetical protein
MVCGRRDASLESQSAKRLALFRKQVGRKFTGRDRGSPLMKAYGTITTHCWIKGHGTHCEVAEEMSLNADCRTTIKRKWRREVEKELVQDSASSPKT